MRTTMDPIRRAALSWALGALTALFALGTSGPSAWGAPDTEPGRLVSVTYPYGKISHIFMSKGEIRLFWPRISINRPWAFPPTQYVYQGSPTITWDRVGRTVTVNGKVTEVVLCGLSTERALFLLNKHRATLQSVVLSGRRRVGAPLLRGLRQLRNRGLLITLTDLPRNGTGWGWLKQLKDRVRGLRLVKRVLTDADLMQVATLSHLEYLDLSQTAVPNAGLRHLARLSRLRDLNLKKTKVGDAGMQHLARLSQLRSLNLWKTKVGDAGLAHLARLTKLRSLT